VSSGSTSGPPASPAKSSSPRSSTARSRALTHADPAEVSLQRALEALADPVRRAILLDLDAHHDWERACGTFDLPVTKATRSHHFAVLRTAGLIEQRDEGPRRLNRIRAAEFDAAFPGLLDAVLRTPHDGPADMSSNLTCST